jgi:hypothetical protein
MAVGREIFPVVPGTCPIRGRPVQATLRSTNP